MLRADRLVAFTVGQPECVPMHDLAGVTDGKRERRYVIFLHEGMREPRHRGTLGRRRLRDAGRIRQRLGKRAAKRWGRNDASACRQFNELSARKSHRVLRTPFTEATASYQTEFIAI